MTDKEFSEVEIEILQRLIEWLNEDGKEDTDSYTKQELLVKFYRLRDNAEIILNIPE